MVAFSTLAAGLFAAASAVNAQTGFYLANTKLTTYVPGPIGDDGNDRFVVSGFWNCDSLTHGRTFNKRSDVSGDKNGVRVKGSASDPEEVEINNTVDKWHVTYYRGTKRLWDTQNRFRGTCVLDSKTARCGLTLGHADYTSRLKCVWA